MPTGSKGRASGWITQRPNQTRAAPLGPRPQRSTNMRGRPPHRNAELRRDTTRTKTKEKQRRRAQIRYARKKAAGWRPSPKPITAEQRDRYNAQRRHRAAHNRTIIKERQETTVREWKQIGAMSIVGATAIHLDQTYWIGPGAGKERQLERQANELLEAAEKREKAAAAAEARKTNAQEAPGRTQATTDDPQHQEKLQPRPSEPQAQMDLDKRDPKEDAITWNELAMIADTTIPSASAPTPNPTTTTARQHCVDIYLNRLKR
jgi:hypothetical protein